MTRLNEEIRLKLAWQSAYEERTCPDGDTLHTSAPGSDLQKHLEICHLCREKREMPVSERNAWQTLRERLATLAEPLRPPVVRASGQVWTIGKKYGRWRGDGRFVRPPAVLLLEEGASLFRWRVAQLYRDTSLMSGGDVPLAERFGFAQGWHCYEVSEALLDRCLGEVAPEELAHVIALSGARHQPAPEGSIISFFRALEEEVGAVMAALQPEAQGETAASTTRSWLEGLFGSVAEVYRKLAAFELPVDAEDVFALLAGARAPLLAGQLSMATSLETITVNIVNKQPDGEIRIRTVNAGVTDDDWQDGTYFIAGKLEEPLPTSLHLLSSLLNEGIPIAECVNQLPPGSPYFDIVFRNVPKSAAALTNVTLLLVYP